MSGSNSLTWNFVGKDNVSREAGKVAKGLGMVGAASAVAIGGLAVKGFEALSGAIRAGFQEAVDYQTQTALTNSALKSTGAAAWISAKYIQDYAGSLESMSGVDEMAINNSENLLLTFDKVKNSVGKGRDVFNQASLAALNMSVFMKKDLAGSSLLVGKALQDPVKGVAALMKNGVSFTQSERDGIKVAMSHNDILGAQKIVLGELNHQFGGAAAAAGRGFAGSLARAKDIGADFIRSIWLKVLPGLAVLADKFASALPGALASAQDAFGKLWTAIGPTVTAIAQKIPGALAAAGVAVAAFLAGFKGGNLGAMSGDMRAVATAGGTVRGAFNALVGAGQALLSFYSEHTTGVNRTIVVSLALYGAIRTGILAYQGYKAVMATVAAVQLAVAVGKQAVALATYGESSSVVLNSAAWVAQKVAMLASAVATKAVAAGQWLLNAALSANPIGLVIVAIAALVAGLVFAYQHSTTFRNIVQAAMAGVKVAFDVVVFSVRNNLVPVFQWLVNMWLNIAGKILDAATWAFGWIPGLGPKLKEAQAGFRNFQTAVNNVLNGLHDKTVTVTFKTIGLNTVLAPGAKMSAIYQFAKGGVVPGPIGKELMAKVHGGELVLNQGQQAAVAAAMAAGSGGGDTTVNVYLDGQEWRGIARTEVINEISNQVRRAKGGGR
jgi:hypothetical protein